MIRMDSNRIDKQIFDKLFNMRSKLNYLKKMEEELQNIDLK